MFPYQRPKHTVDHVWDAVQWGLRRSKWRHSEAPLRDQWAGSGGLAFPKIYQEEGGDGMGETEEEEMEEEETEEEETEEEETEEEETEEGNTEK